VVDFGRFLLVHYFALILIDLLILKLEMNKQQPFSRVISTLFVVTVSNILCVADGLGYVDTSEWVSLDGGHHHSIAAFYNVYCGGKYFDGIVKDQVSKMEASGLMDRLDIVYYATMGEYGADYSIPNNKFKHIKHHGKEGSEAQTHHLMYQFCHDNPTSKVLYFHNKGSYHPTADNSIFRSYLDCYNLNPNCIEALDTHDICGWRLTPVPHPFYSGNFWWATCKHINGLVSPMSNTQNETFIALSNKVNPCVLSFGRWFSEAWVTSKPEYKPADCMILGDCPTRNTLYSER